MAALAKVSIDIGAMRALVRSMEAAGEDIPRAAASFNLSLLMVGLPTSSQDQVSYTAPVPLWIEVALRDLNRRLTLAEMIQRSSPGLNVVTFNDKHLSTDSDAQIGRKIDRIEQLLDQETDEVDPELLSLLKDNSLDPYFAKALAEAIPPEELDGYLAKLEEQYRSVPHDDPSGTEPRENEGVDPTSLDVLRQEYDKLNSALGVVFGLASQGRGSLAVPGMADDWAAHIRGLSDDGGAGPIRLAQVIGDGQWSDDFLVETYRAAKDAGGDAGANTWTVDMKIFDGDPLSGILRAMQLNPDAVRRTFAVGPRTTITVDGAEVSVDQEMWEVFNRPGYAAQELVGALTAGIGAPPVEGQRAWQPALARDLTRMSGWIDDQVDAAEAEQQEAEDEAGPLWKRLAHGALDLTGLVPVVGELFDAVNAVWYFADGDVINGALSAGSVVPFVGWGFQGGKWVRTGLKASDLAKLSREAKDGRLALTFVPGGRVIPADKLDDPGMWAAENFLTPAELRLWSGNRSFMRRVIAGNRFNAMAVPHYKYNEITLVPAAGRRRGFRVDSLNPPIEIVSRKHTQFGQVKPQTAKNYVDEFRTKYPPGTIIGDTRKNRDLGIAGQALRGDMVMEVPPQFSGAKLDAILKYAQDPRLGKVYIKDFNGQWLTPKPPGV